MAVARRPPLPPATVARIVATVLAGERRRAEVTVTFVGPQRIRTLNREWLGHDRVTDVIAFTLDQPGGGSTVGDVYICRAVAEREARRRGIPARQELVRLVVHGTLHVLGWDHPEGDATARERSDMWKRQERYVRRLTA